MIFNLSLCLIIVFIYIITHIGQKNKAIKDKLFLICSFVCLFILVSSREFTRGNDTLNYIESFKYFAITGWKSNIFNNYYEPGYVIFNILISYFSKNSRFFLVVLSLIFNYSVYNFIKENSKNYFLSVMMYINILFFYDSMTMMRQFFALSIILLGFKYVKQGKFFKYLLTVILACLFHSSAFIGIFIYPIYKLKYDKIKVLIMMISSLIIFIFLEKIYPIIISFLNRENYYSSTIGDAKLANFMNMLFFLLMFIISLIIIGKKEKKEFSFYLYCLLFSSCIYFISIDMAVLSRAAQYYSIFSIIAFTNIIELNLNKNRIFLIFLVCILLLTYSSIIIVYRPEWNTAFNYKSCIFPNNGYICYK